ncbi:protein croquemort-like isoform X2 [Homalodisca vitripennis]|uniref:protein croquemort-like isoform X2 n=1 Tax=Homalodisca vitripennis TaxID=197043 RepID=UPI001EEA83C1|nr:protein croquemort-like isoform X2 [Homalodisca vitripennis]
MSLTADGVFTMGSGLGNIDDLGLMTAWNYRNRSVYPGECGRIHGTYGEEFPPNSVYQSDITLYANDLCSVLNLKRQKASSVRGIPSVLFAGGPDVFSNETTCYCRNSSNCPASGVRDLSLCNGSPAMVSWPHFYLADPSYRKAVVGMNPDAEHHQFYMDMAEHVQEHQLDSDADDVVQPGGRPYTRACFTDGGAGGVGQLGPLGVAGRRSGWGPPGAVRTRAALQGYFENKR